MSETFGQTNTGRFLSNTPGFGWLFEAITGTPSQVRVDEVKQSTANSVGRSVQNRDEVIKQVNKEQEDFLRSVGQHPEQAEFRAGAFTDAAQSLGFEGVGDAARKAAQGFVSFVPWLILVSAGGLTLYFGFKFYQATRRR